MALLDQGDGYDWRDHRTGRREVEVAFGLLFLIALALLV